MKILLVNYRYFISGGPERYLFNVTSLLESHGHEVIPFSVKHNSNFPCEYEKYFVSPIGKGDITYFSDINKTRLNEIMKFFSRMFFSFEVRRNFRKLATDTKPDIVYVLHYQNKLSPSFIGVAKRLGLPVVQRISDFGHICANQLFYNYKLKSICEKCLSGTKLNAVRYNCVYGSKGYSLIKILALKTHELMGIYRKINAFVVPSEFTISKLKSSGIPENKLLHLPTFYKKVGSGCSEQPISYGNFALYIGRIEEEKGIMTMVKAFEGTDMNLKIIGFSSKNYENQVVEFLENKKHKIEFLGRQPFEIVKQYLSACAFTICPSECYDNFPNSVIESFAFQKSVVCSDLGSLREMVEHELTGMLYTPGDYFQLREYCRFMFSNPDKCKRMGQEGRIIIRNRLSEEKHYQRLISLFQTMIESKNVDL